MRATLLLSWTLEERNSAPSLPFSPFPFRARGLGRIEARPEVCQANTELHVWPWSEDGVPGMRSGVRAWAVSFYRFTVMPCCKPSHSRGPTSPLIPNPIYSQFRKPSSKEVCMSLSPQPVATTLRGFAIDFQESQLPPALLLPPSSLSPDSCLHIQAHGQQNCMVSSQVEHGDIHL